MVQGKVCEFIIGNIIGDFVEFLNKMWIEFEGDSFYGGVNYKFLIVVVGYVEGDD